MAQKKKIVLIGPEAKEKLLAGVDLLANAVKLTLGPMGRNFASGVRGGPVVVSNDGVSLAREIQGKDEFEDMGVRAVKEAATKTNDKAGDGTTTAVVLVQATLRAIGFDKDTIGSNPNGMVQKVREESEQIVTRLNEMAVPITSREHLISIAKVSVEDEALAELIGGAQWDVGAAGTVMAEESNSPNDSVEFIYGVRIDNGYGTSRIANNQEKQALELKDVRIIVTNKLFNTAQTIRDLNDVFDALIKDGAQQVVLIGRAFDDTAIALCVKNIQNFYTGKGGFPIYPLNAPYTDQEEVLEDLAATTGAKFINGAERNLQSISLKDVGIATKVFCTRYEGIVTGLKKGDDERVDGLMVARVTRINEKLQGNISPFEKKALEARLAQLTAGTAIIKVGAETEQERAYRKAKVDDAVNAVKAAMQEGVVPGAGKALMSIADEMPDSLIGDALRAPYRQIMANAGGEFEVPEWVEDPLKVVRTAFEKASSIARSLATTEILVTWEWEKESCHGGIANLAPNDEA